MSFHLPYTRVVPDNKLVSVEPGSVLLSRDVVSYRSVSHWSSSTGAFLDIF